MSRPARAIVDLDALRHNYRLAQSLSGTGQALPIIKANAYGHGAIAVGKALAPLAPALGVACMEEALELRDAGIDKPLLLLEGAFSEQEILTASREHLWLMVTNRHQAEMISHTRPSRPLKVWLKMDSGMHRLGVPADEVRSVHALLKECPHVTEEIIITTHLATADELNSPFVEDQLSCFDQATGALKGPRSIANSAAILEWQAACREWNRPGIMLYGCNPFMQPHPQADRLKPVMTLKSAVISINRIAPGEPVGYGCTWRAERASVIAVIAIGYGDGYPRNAPAGTPVLINGHRAPLAGRVSMDMITVDVTELENVQIGDEATLWGEGVPLNEIAAKVDTIGYELVTRMPQRTPRQYRSGTV